MCLQEQVSVHWRKTVFHSQEIPKSELAVVSPFFWDWWSDYIILASRYSKKESFDNQFSVQGLHQIMQNIKCLQANTNRKSETLDTVLD